MTEIVNRNIIVSNKVFVLCIDLKGIKLIVVYVFNVS